MCGSPQPASTVPLNIGVWGRRHRPAFRLPSPDSASDLVSVRS